MSILILNREDMKQVFTMKEAIIACKDALQAYSEGNVTIPLRANLSISEFDGHNLYMYGYVPAAEALGVKIVSVYPKNIEKGITSVPATMVLVDAHTGVVCGLMDGTYLTCLRTGAVAGAATDILARKESTVFALFGAGGQAESQLEAVITVRPIEKVNVYDINLERAQEFVKTMNQKFGQRNKVQIVVAATPEEALKDADIITAVTTSSNALFDGSMVKPNAHINGMGSYTPAMAEIDEFIVCNSKVYVDTADAIKESGDLIQPIEKGCLDKNKIQELGMVLLNKVSARENDKQMTFFESTGSAVLDLVTAQRIFQAAKEKRIGKMIEF
ncbi:ornithine cyclodeaminase family protein [Clostridiales bacterium COT073_COT-073]|nr:ornithine cyclodeaminase family protein [Clostridiales bacterium COT073_COT-073]